MGGRVMSTLLEMLGLVLLVTGVAMWSLPAALVVGGSSLVLLAVAMDGRVQIRRRA